MEYKLTQEVKFKGAKIELGYNNPVFLSPKDKTYIWEVIHRENNKPLYIIQHPEGREIDFFQQNAPGFGVDNFNNLQKMVEQIGKPIKFAYATAGFLEPINQPTEKTIEKPIGLSGNIEQNGSNNVDLSEEQKQEELKSITEYLEEESLIDNNKELEDEHKRIKLTPNPEKSNANTSLNIPHFTFEGLNTNEMDKVSPKPQKLWATQMPVSFSIEKPNGIAEIGNKSDYLVASQNGFLSIETEESFNEKYQENKKLVNKAIGAGDEEFLLHPKVAEYITFLEKENVRVRTEAFLNKKK
ncbi:MAG: hypothetical protein PHT69_02180 [Bacteroidales bacterium]|nr:hypothetical protein [Bacteroidales bacterium]